MTPRFSHVHWSLCNVNHPYIVVHHWWWYITSIWNQSDIIWRCLGKHWCTAPLITDSATIISIVIDQLLTKHHLSWIMLLSHSNQAFKHEVGFIFLRHRRHNHPNYILNYEWLINHFFQLRKKSLSSTAFLSLRPQQHSHYDRDDGASQCEGSSFISFSYIKFIDAGLRWRLGNW